MPQININEIDQSVFTRVVNDDKVKVLVPCIASFGPVYDGVEDSAMTFTDVTAFEKVFGYTEPEYNPFPYDVSRTYIKQLINRGAAVSVVRVNNGTKAYYTMDDGTFIDKDASDAESLNKGAVPAATHVDGYTGDVELLTAQPSDWTDNYTSYFTKITTGDRAGKYIPVTGATAPAWATDTYYKQISNKFRFCDQITNINAKYTGSFGNHLLVTFTPVTSVNVNFPYQYSIVTVYNADILISTSKQNVYAQSALATEPDDWATQYFKYYKKTTTTEGVDIYTQVTVPTPFASGQFYAVDHVEIVTNKTITGVHKLEDHMVTTNPNDVNYIEDVVFNFIEFVLTPNARDEFTVAWSNLSNTSALTDVDAGFPEIPLKYTENGIPIYNEDALLDKGYDFIFNNDLVQVLDTGYQTVTMGNGKLTVGNVNEYILECYGNPNPTDSIPGVVSTVLENIRQCYANYSDPYIYDFDFVTTGGFINENFTIYDKGEITIIVTTRAEMTTATNAGRVLICNSDRLTNKVIPSVITPLHAGMLNLVKSRKDCIALADVNPGWNPSDLPQYVEYLNESQCTVHSPWCYTADPYNNNALTLMPPSFVFLYTLLSNLINSPDSQKWFPPAGVTRATARVVVKPYYEIGSTLLNAWQNDTLARVNPIMRLKNYGYVIYGQYTSYVAIDQFTHSALESLNVRLVANCVKKQIFNLCLKLAFEPNNSSLWFKFYDGMDKYLLFMKRNDGVYDYRIQMDESTVTTDDINELRCPGKVWINPTRTAEFFDIDFILTEAGVTFNEEGE